MKDSQHGATALVSQCTEDGVEIFQLDNTTSLSRHADSDNRS